MTEAAARTARAAAALGPNVYAESVAERLSIAERDAGYLSERLFEQARQESDAVAQRELYDVLSRIDEARGESSSALLWQSAILERSENHLPSLRKLEHAYISQGRDDELESVASRLATILDAGESDAHVSLALQLRARRGEWASGKELAEIAAQRETPSLWALRALSVQAHFADDPATIFKVDQKLLDFAPTPLDKATFALRAAEAAVRLSELETAEKLLQTALSHVPEHLVALTTLGEVLERLERFEEAARVFETLAIASQVPAHRVSALYQAACLWQEKAGQEDQATRALEEAADYDILHREVFARLRDLYIKQDERAKLAGLLERRLAQTQDPDERIAIEVMRGKALAGVGEHEEAKRALAAALDNNPEHADALEAFADLCRDSGDYTSAEQAYIRLVRHVADPERQAGIYRRLAALYDGPLPNLERAELAHQEVLKRVPGDVATAERLILVYGRMDQKEKALALQQELIEKAETTEDKRDRTLGLSRLYETVLGDKRKAQLTLDRARRTFHHDEVVLTATVEFHRRQDDERSLGLLLDRTLSEARRALGTGRFDRGLFQVLAAAAEHKGELGLASLARASLAAIDGTPSDLAGAAQGAADPALDDLLSPEHVGLPLRSLLEKAGAMLDAAYPVDLRTLRAAPLPTEAQAFKAEVAEVATSFGIPNLDVFVAPQLGKVCLGISSFPPQVVFGQELIDSDDEALRSFLLIRALKLVSVQGTAITRMAPIDLWPNLAGFLSVLCPEWEPPPMDAGKLSAAKQRVEASLTRRIDDDVPLLALEVANTIGNRASQLGTLFFEWANRTALLAVGDPGIALRAIASASGHELPQDQTQRLKWIGRNSEARDLMVFSITDAYAEARKRVGL